MALKALVNVGTTAYGLAFSPEVYAEDLSRLEPDHPLLTWGALGHLAPQLNVLKQYRLIEKGKCAEAAADLRPLRDGDRVELVSRVRSLRALLRGLTPRVNALRRITTWRSDRRARPDDSTRSGGRREAAA